MDKQSKIVLAIIVAGALIAVGIYFSGRSNKEEPMITVPATSTVDNMEVFKTSFIEGCMDGDAVKFAMCNCAYDKMLNKYGVDGFLKISTDYIKTQQMPESVVTTIIGCAK